MKRNSLYLAWDFTVASTENLTGRMLSIRDRAFALLGDTDLDDGIVQGDSPEFTITDVINDPVNRPNLARQVDGHLRGALLPGRSRLPDRLELQPRR